MLAKIKFIEYGKLSSKEYDYETWIDDLQEDDYVVVEAGNAYGIAVFQRYIGEDERKDFEYKFLVQKLPINMYEELKKQYKEEK